MALSTANRSRYRGAGPWPSGQFYVWDCRKSGITKPLNAVGHDWRLSTMAEAEAAAEELNDARDDGLYSLFRYHPELASGDYFARFYRDGLEGRDPPQDDPELAAWEAGHDTARKRSPTPKD